jgi:HAD superfamily hydrolase (TIGR01509 family)
MPLEALIFDVDGTLAETEEMHRRAFNDTFEALRLGWVWSPDIYRQLLQITGSRERLEYFVKVWNPPRADWALAHLTEIQTERAARYVDFVNSGAILPRPGICRLVREAHARRILLAIATTSLPANVAALLRKMLEADAPSWFQVIAAGDVVPAKKPAPDVYLYVLRKLGCAASASVAFEDSHNGVEAAAAAGITTIATPSAYLTEDDFTRATSVVSDLGEPGQPLRPIRGWRFPKGYVDLDGLADLASNPVEHQ